MFKCSCCRMKCDEGSDAWSNLRISHIHVFLKNLRQHVPRKKNMEFAKVRRTKFFLAKMTFSRWKNLEQPSYVYSIDIYIYIFIGPTKCKARGGLWPYIYNIYVYTFAVIYLYMFWPSQSSFVGLHSKLKSTKCFCWYVWAPNQELPCLLLVTSMFFLEYTYWGKLMIRSVDGSEIPRPTTWDGAKTQ